MNRRQCKEAKERKETGGWAGAWMWCVLEIRLARDNWIGFATGLVKLKLLQLVVHGTIWHVGKHWSILYIYYNMYVSFIYII